MSELCDFERELLLAMAGKRPALPWGAAVGAALEFLSGAGLVECPAGRYQLTAAGQQLAEAMCKSR